MDPMPPIINWTVSQALGVCILACAVAATAAVLYALFRAIWLDARRWWQRRRVGLAWRPTRASLAAWSGHTGPWWRFWHPSSGMAGGVILGTIGGALILAALWWGMR